uniref:Rx N-terminal domain-containing protein n=1 Tax=Oryza barthii TaxID=65489 RepID=A0A0D3FRY2_9ORYZ
MTAFHKSDKLRDLESRILPRLALLLEHAVRIPPEQEQIRADMEQWACRLRSAFYDVEDILDVADYNRLENKAN